MISKSKRNQFTGVHLTSETKSKVKEKARKERKSVSQVISDAVEKDLSVDTPVTPATPLPIKSQPEDWRPTPLKDTQEPQ